MYLAKFIKQARTTLGSENVLDIECHASEYANDGGMIVADRLKNAITEALLSHTNLGIDVSRLVVPFFGTYADYRFAWDNERLNEAPPTFSGMVNTYVGAQRFKGNCYNLKCENVEQAIRNLIQVCTVGTRQYLKQNTDKSIRRVSYYDMDFMVNAAGDVVHYFMEDPEKCAYNLRSGSIYRERLGKVNVNTIIDLDEIFLHALVEHLTKTN